MKLRPLILALLLSVVTLPASARELYLKTFGRSSAPALIFLHGGPGYNSASFEGTTAQRLADSGFFVIVYDRRGEGRSPDTAARFTFQQTSADIQQIYDRFHLKKASLIGHSFGGVVGIEFAEAHPELVRSLLLVSAPVDIQGSFRNILDRCQAIYERKGDSTNLAYIHALKKMDTASLMYATYCLGHAMQNGFYTPANRSEEAKAIYARYRADTAHSKYASQMDFLATKGFWANEHYTTLDLRNNVADLLKKRVRIFGIYGREDGLYAIDQQIGALRKQLGSDNFLLLDNCSHNVFIDQQAAFIAALQRWAR